MRLEPIELANYGSPIMNMTAQKVEQAALNNALWCDAVCATHDCAGEFREAAWINLQQAPPFYPNAVTLGDARQVEAHKERIAEMVRAGLPEGWAIKDSFQTLNLDSIGGEVWFEAQWLYRSATSPLAIADISGVRWQVVTDLPTLEAWETAWRGDSGVEGLFLPALLNHQDVKIIAAWRGDQIVAGAIANRAADCVGISNVFLPVQHAQEFRNDCIASALRAFPGLPLVGYESGSEITEMQVCGFEAVGALSVWRQASKTESSP